MSLKVGRTTLRTLFFGSAVSAAFVGCQLFTVPPDAVKLTLGVQAPVVTHAISASDYRVTSLDLAVTEVATSTVAFSVNWIPTDGATQYNVSVPNAGDYTISVTHNGELGGDTIAATEAVIVTLQPLIVSVVTVIPGQIGVIVVGETGVFDQSRFGQAFYGP